PLLRSIHTTPRVWLPLDRFPDRPPSATLLCPLSLHDALPISRAGLSDHDRALTLDGRRQAARLGERLAEAGIVPQHVLVSSATRAQQTWARMAVALDAERVDTVPGLYSAGIGGYQDALAVVGDADGVATGAHEPTASGFARWLAGDGSDREAFADVAYGLVTS